MKPRILSLFFLMLVFSAIRGFSQSINLELNPALKNQMTITESPLGTFDITTSGVDPWVQTKPVAAYNPDSVYVVSFEYLAPNGLDDLEIFYGAPVNALRTVKLGSLPKTTAFTTYKVLMKFVAPTWNAFYERFRFDFGKQAGQNIKVRNVVIRAALPAEVIALNPDLTKRNQMNITKRADGSYDIGTTGIDPWVISPINTTFDPQKVYVISFDYIAAAGLDDLEIFYGAPFSTARRALLGSLTPSTAYKNFKTLMRLSAPIWNESYNQVRFDFGKAPGQNINVKNLVLREATSEEAKALEIKETVNIRLDPSRTSPFLSATQLPDGSYQLKTSANDPWIQSFPINELYDINETYILSFEYKTDTAYNELEIFYGPPITTTQAGNFGSIPVATDWTPMVINPKLTVDNFQEASRTLFRFDFGRNENESKTIFIRNIKLRKPTAEELVIEQTSDKIVSQQLNTQFLSYLNATFTDSISLVKVDTAKVTVKGTVSGTESEYYLAEIEPHQYDFNLNQFSTVVPLLIDSNSFTLTLDRFLAKTDRNYDRLYSRWAVVKKNGDTYALLSNATWAGDISEISINNFTEKKATSKKGLDGLVPATLPYFSDLTDLNIKSMKINLLLNGAFSLAPTSLVHNFNGKDYHINPNFITQLDNSVKSCTDNDMLVSMVVLIPLNINNETLREIWLHPDARLGLYSMANVATEIGVEHYTAMIDFLSKRYSTENNQYGRVDHWIIHNEVDAHESWTHAGAKPAPLYTEIYQRSMRLVHYTIRKHNPTAKVFASFTKHFNSRVDNRSFLSKEILDVLGKISKKEGDFEWGIGWHSYPTNLFNPKVWNDAPIRTQFNFNTPEITPKNIEVIDAYVRQKSQLYNGKKVRTVILSENGFSSNTERNINANDTTQAAALAYFWKKTNNRVPAIESIQLHRWIDNPNEGGLLFGLWTNKPGTVTEPDIKKLGWFVWEAAGTSREDSVFAPYKEVVGINDWAEINNTMPSEVTPYSVNITLANCASNLNALTIAFNGEIRRPQSNGAIQFYNVASNVPQPYQIFKDGKLIKEGSINVNSDLNYAIDIAPDYALEGKGISSTAIKLNWKNTGEATGYIIEAKNGNRGFEQIAVVGAADSAYVHQGLNSGTLYTYRIAQLQGDIQSCYSDEIEVTAPFILVEHKDGDNGKTLDNDMKPNLRLVNTASYPIDYNSLKIRYWFTVEDYDTLEGAIDYALIGKQNINTSFVLLDTVRQGANAYAELSFTASAGSIAALGNSGEIKLRINKENYSAFNESDDYSYAANSAYTGTSKITIYQDGKLIWGDEPEIVSQMPLFLKVQYRNKDANVNNNSVKPAFIIINESMTPIEYKDITLRYWFTAEGDAELQFSSDYIERLSGKINASFKPLNSLDSADHYLEIGFTEDSGLLYGLSNSGRIETRFSKADWTAFNELNDFSYRSPFSTSDYISNSHITLYYKGQLVYGQEPVSVTTTTMVHPGFNELSLDFPTHNSTSVYPNPTTANLYLNLDNSIRNINSLVVMDVQGRKIQIPYENNNGVLIMNTSNLTAGSYILQLISNSKMYHYKFLINNQ